MKKLLLLLTLMLGLTLASYSQSYQPGRLYDHNPGHTFVTLGNGYCRNIQWYYRGVVRGDFWYMDGYGYWYSVYKTTNAWSFKYISQPYFCN